MPNRYCLQCGGVGSSHLQWCADHATEPVYRHTAPPGPAAHQARRTDPATSHAAAAGITLERLTAVQRLVMDQLRTHGPMTDDELLRSVAIDTGKDYPASTIKTRRSELVAAGVIVDTGETRPTRFGRAAIVWAAA